MTTDATDIGQSDWDHIRVEGDGKHGHGMYARVYRNGVLIPKLVSFRLEVDDRGVQTLTTTQYVVLEKDEDVVERATQALEEREELWRDEEGIRRSGPRP